MSWHKHKQYDPTEAFLANNKQQKLLELKIKDIDRLWFARLKYYAKDKLENTTELLRLMEDKRQLDHFNDSLTPEELKLYTDHMGNAMKALHKDLSSDNFDFDKYKRRRRSSTMGITRNCLPRIEKQNTEVNFKLRRESMISRADLRNADRASRNSNITSRHSNRTSRTSKPKIRGSDDIPSSLKSSRFMSMSDTDLYKKTRENDKSASRFKPLKRSTSDLEQRLKTDLYKKSKDFKNARLDLESILRVADVNSPEVTSRKGAQSKNNRKLPILEPKKLVVSKDEHRYLKHRMETVILPPLSEDSQKRKMSC